MSFKELGSTNLPYLASTSGFCESGSVLANLGVQLAKGTSLPCKWTEAW